MALFKMLHGDSSNISTDVTPFHEGWCYISHDGYFYVDLNIGTEETPNNQRIKLNAKDAETFGGHTPNEFLLKSEASGISVVNETLILDATKFV